MMSREQLTKDGWRFAGAVDGADGVVCFTSPKRGLFGIWSCVGKAGDFSHREKYNALCERAMAKLNYRRDRRCKTSWRFVGTEVVSNDWAAAGSPFAQRDLRVVPDHDNGCFEIMHRVSEGGAS